MKERKIKRQCKYCEFCEQIGRQQSNSFTYGRKQYWCKHLSVKTMNDQIFGNKARGFIGFGNNDLESKLAIKTHPRWCPLENKSSS